MSKMMLISSAQAQTLSTQLSTATQTVTAAANQAAAQAANPYGLGAIWSQGDWVAKLCLLLLVIMSVASWAVMLRKFLELRKTEAHTSEAHAAFDNITTVGDKLAKLSSDNPLKFVNEAACGLRHLAHPRD
jgi:biopolymer transport protein ExbB